jgi:putative DNA primase/helicase
MRTGIRAERAHTARTAKKRTKKFAKLAPRFTDRNTPVFPVASNGKTPCTEHGFKDATTDPEQIRKWAKKFPKANIGITTGQASGFIVIDLDRKGGVDGVKAFESLCRRLDIEIPDTYKIKTPSGGRHLFFHIKHAGLIRNSAGILAPGVDVRGEGGYVVAEGSSIGGNKYERISGSLDDVKLLPKALRLKILNTRRERHGHGDGTYAEGQRNDALFRDACGFRATGRSFERTLEQIRALNLSACKPPLDDKEVVSIVESAFTYENTPRPNESPETALTDMGSARRLAVANHGKLAYIHETRTWISRSEGGYWQDMPGIEYERVKQAARNLQVEVLHIESLKEQEQVSKFALRSQSRHSIEATVALARSEPELSRSIDQFDIQPWHLAVANGVYNLKAGEFHEPTADDHMLKVSPVRFNPDADCPLWLEFMEFIQPQRSMRRYLQKLVGATLVGGTLEEIVIFLYGVANSGKSTFINTVMRVLGPTLAIKILTEVLLARGRGSGSPNELARLKGARMAVASEVPEGRRFNEAALKDLSSRDPLTARFLYGEFFQFLPSHTLWIYGNHRPRISGSDTGVWRRMRVVPFDTVIPTARVVKDFEQRLIPELPGVLNWLIDGCHAWQAHGARPPKKVRQVTDLYRSDNDLMSQFLEEMTVKQKDASVKASYLYNVYAEWAANNGETPMSNTRFGSELIDRGYDRSDRRDGWYYEEIEVTVLVEG